MIRLFKYLLLVSIVFILFFQLFFLTRDVIHYLAGEHYQIGIVRQKINLILIIKSIFSILVFFGLLVLTLYMAFFKKSFWLATTGSALLLVGIVGYILTYFL